MGLLGVSSSPVRSLVYPIAPEIEAAVALQFVTWAEEAEVAVPSIIAEI